MEDENNLNDLKGKNGFTLFFIEITEVYHMGADNTKIVFLITSTNNYLNH